MAIKVSELLEAMVESLNSKIETEQEEQLSLQEVIANAQVKLTASQLELVKAEDTLASIQAI